MAKEIERKFLVDHISETFLSNRPSNALLQGYLILDGTNELRIRKLDSHYFITRKTGSGLIREEEEESISETLFLLMWPLTDGNRVEKRRYPFYHEDILCELDIYTGKLEGLITLEAEFKSEAEANRFSPPPFCTKDVTQNPEYKNSHLAQYGLPA